MWIDILILRPYGTLFLEIYEFYRYFVPTGTNDDTIMSVNIYGNNYYLLKSIAFVS
jgi:hypothetical protein